MLRWGTHLVLLESGGSCALGLREGSQPKVGWGLDHSLLLNLQAVRKIRVLSENGSCLLSAPSQDSSLNT